MVTTLNLESIVYFAKIVSLAGVTKQVFIRVALLLVEGEGEGRWVHSCLRIYVSSYYIWGRRDSSGLHAYRRTARGSLRQRLGSVFRYHWVIREKIALPPAVEGGVLVFNAAAQGRK